MDIVVLKNRVDVTRNRHRLKCPSHLSLPCNRYQPFQRQSARSKLYDDDEDAVTMHDIEEVADLLTKMNYRICDDGFYIPSPAAPTDNTTFTFDGLYSDETATSELKLQPLNTCMNSFIHSQEHQTKDRDVFTETNVYNLMDNIRQQQQHLMSLPSCQYSPRTAKLHFTPNIAESIMTEELSINYNNILEIIEKPLDDDILDDALDKIEAREEEEDEASTWTVKEEMETWKPEKLDAILDLPNPESCVTVLQMEVLTSEMEEETTTNQTTTAAERTINQTSPEVKTVIDQTPSDVEEPTSQIVPEVERTPCQTILTPGLTVLREIGRTEIQVVGKHFICDLCGKGFSQSCTMRNHRRTHTGERPFKCDLCSRRFSDMSTFRKHGRVHTRDRPFTCNICNKSFAQSGNLYRHKRNMHTNNL